MVWMAESASILPVGSAAAATAQSHHAIQCDSGRRKLENMCGLGPLAAVAGRFPAVYGSCPTKARKERNVPRAD